MHGFSWFWLLEDDYIDTPTWKGKSVKMSKNKFFDLLVSSLQFFIRSILSSLSSYLILNHITIFISFICKLLTFP